MLLDFQFSNFRSFKDLTRLTMLAAPKRANDNGESDEHVFEWNGMRLLKSKAIYGANASGKSNAVSALSVLLKMVKDSVRQERMPEAFWSGRYHFSETSIKDPEPIFFQLTGGMDDVIYRYGFRISNAEIESEWLFLRLPDSETEEQVFIRQKGEVEIAEPYMPETKSWKNQLETGELELFRKDALFLTIAALMGTKLAIEIRNAIGNETLLSGLNDEQFLKHVQEVFETEDSDIQSFLNDFLKSADTGTIALKAMSLGEHLDDENIPTELLAQAEKLKNLKTLFSIHQVYDEKNSPIYTIEVPLENFASTGTKRLLALGFVLYHTLKRGSALIIDEFDSRLHPNLTAKILELFHNSKTNPNNAQLIFVTHDTGLLRRAGLRRDQIAIIDKDPYGASHLTTLIEYKGVRKDASLEKEYLRGAYRGVPNLNRLDDVVEDLFAE